MPVRVDEQSFGHFVYPFLFDMDTFNERADKIDHAQWNGRKQALKVWNLHQFPEDDLLPHVARYLNQREGNPPTAYLWQLDGNTLQSPQGLGGSAQWNLIYPHGEVPFHIDDIQLALSASVLDS